MSEKTISERDAAFDEGSSSLEMLPVALDVTSSSQEVDLSELNDDLVKFLQDDSVRDDLIKGVDLQQYSRDIEQQLKKAEEASILDCTSHHSSSLEKLHLNFLIRYKKCRQNSKLV